MLLIIVYSCLPLSGLSRRFRGATHAVGRVLVGSHVNRCANHSGETKTGYRVCVFCSYLKLNEHVQWFTFCVYMSENVQFLVWV